MNKKPHIFSQVAALLGNILEHHDKALFVLLAPFIAEKYFPSDDLLVSLIQIYGVLLISLLVRPFGAFFMGRFADFQGRKKALVFSMSGMALSTLGIGLLPTYETIGLQAPLLLFICRCGQNFFGSAETTNSAVYLLEHSEKKKKPLIASIFEASTMLGVAFASVETTILAYFGLLESSWHYLFILAAALSLIVLSIRKYAVESPAFTPQVFQLHELTQNKFPLLVIVMTSAFSSLTYILSITFINGYLKVYTDLDALELTSLNTILIFFDLVALPCFGYLAELTSPAIMMSRAAFCLAIFAPALFILMDSFQTVFVILFVRLVIVIGGVCFAAPSRAFLQEITHDSRRCTLLNVGGSLGQLFAEGPLTLLAFLAMRGGLWFLPALILAGLGLTTAFLIRKVMFQRDISSLRS